VIEPGAVAVLARSDGWRVYWAPPEAPAEAFDLATGDVELEGIGATVSGFSAGDLDDDGRTDLVVAGKTPCVVWDAAGESPRVEAVPFERRPARMRDVALADFDEDGDLDGVAVYTAPTDADGVLVGDLLVNDGARMLRLTPIDEVPAGTWGPAFDATALDVDADGHVDVLLCNDSPTDTQRNAVLFGDGRGGFTRGADTGLEVGVDCMGATAADADADGDLDVVLGETRRVVLLEQADAAWSDAGFARGLDPWSGTVMAFGVGAADLDNDGGVDLVAPLSDFYTAESTPTHPVLRYSRGADGGYTAVDGLPLEGAARTVVPVDLDGDGSLELVMGDAFRSPWVVRGPGCVDGAWIAVEAPLNSVARVTAGGITRAGLVTNERSYASAGPAVAHVGLGDVDAVERLVLTLPDGEEVSIE
jgi:hypothetical protein